MQEILPFIPEYAGNLPVCARVHPGITIKTVVFWPSNGRFSTKTRSKREILHKKPVILIEKTPFSMISLDMDSIWVYDSHGNPLSRRCSDCSSIKGLDFFNKNSSKKYGIHSRCRDCHNEMNRKNRMVAGQRLAQLTNEHRLEDLSDSDKRIWIAVHFNLTKTFFEKINKTESCWLWTGQRRPNGYGQYAIVQEGISLGPVLSHRLSYAIENGSIPPASIKQTKKSMTINHICNVPLCVNPQHLEAITMEENLLYREMSRDFLGLS